MDLVTEYTDDGGDKVAMLRWARTDDRKAEMNVTSSISHFPDPRTFAVVDEGCNATVHTTA